MTGDARPETRSERMPAKTLLAELAAVSTGPVEPWPVIEATTDDSVTGLDDDGSDPHDLHPR